eukprot:3308362-Rhodomonas_salina.2
MTRSSAQSVCCVRGLKHEHPRAALPQPNPRPTPSTRIAICGSASAAVCECGVLLGESGACDRGNPPECMHVFTGTAHLHSKFVA